MISEAIKMKLSKLVELSSEGHIDNDWVESFIHDVNNRVKQGRDLTALQILKVEELFEQY